MPTVDQIKAKAEQLKARYVSDVRRSGYRENMAVKYRDALEKFIGDQRGYDYSAFWAIERIKSDLSVFCENAISE